MIVLLRMASSPERSEWQELRGGFGGGLSGMYLIDTGLQWEVGN